MSGKCRMTPIFATEKFLSIIYNDAELEELYDLCLAEPEILNRLEDLAADVIEIMCEPEYYSCAIRSLVIGRVEEKLLRGVYTKVRFNNSLLFWELEQLLGDYRILQTTRFWLLFIHCLPVPQDFILK